VTPSPPPPSKHRRAAWVGLLLLLASGAVYVAMRGEPATDDEAATPSPSRPPSSSPPRPNAAAPDPDQETADDDHAPGEVAVRVLGDDQAPLRGARVQLIPLDEAHGSSPPPCPCVALAPPRPAPVSEESGEERGSVLDGCGLCAEAQQLLFEDGTRGGGFLADREALTDAQGTVRFLVTGRARFAIWIEAAGFRPASQLLDAVDVGDEASDVELTRLSPLKVRIEDGEGRPIPGASLALFCALPFRALGPVRSGAVHTLDGLPTGAEVHLVARAPGFLPQDLLAPDEPDEPLVIQLQQPRRVVGRVLHGEAPVAGATLRLSTNGQRTDLTATSDRDGRFTIEGAGDAAYTLTGDKGKLHGELSLEVSEQMPVVAVLLVESASVEGVVTEAVTGAPIEGAEVVLRGEEDGVVSAQTDATGHFSLQTGPGQFSLQVADERHLTTAAPLRVAEGQSLVHDVVLASGNAVGGVVLDGKGAPVEGAQVSVEVGDNREGDGLSRGASTDAQGHFELGGLPDGAHLISVIASEHPPLTQRLNLPAHEVVLRLLDGTTIEGEVEGPHGPLESARVEIAPTETVGRSGMTAVQTDATGHFRATGQAPGSATLYAVAEGLAPSEPVSLVVQDGQTARVRFVLNPGLEIRGQVQDDRGLPLAEAMVEAYADTTRTSPIGHNASVTSAADGTFTLGGLHAGSYFVYAYRDGLSQSAPVAVAAGTRALVLKLARGARVAGRVISRSGAPVRRFTIEGQDFRSVEGTFLLKDASADAAELFIEGPFPTRRISVKLRAGETTDVGDVLVDDGDELHGLVRSPEGRPAPGVQVVALPPGLDPSAVENPSEADPLLDSPRTVTSDADGRFAFAHLRPGTYLLQASNPRTASASQHASSKGGEVVLELLPGVTLRGRAALPDGTLLEEGMAIYVSGAITAEARVVGGTFELTGLPAGPGELMVTGGSRASRATGNQALTLTAGEVREVAISLRSQPSERPRESPPTEP
jgi:protocatechuate 3,4-dioxygenase beta subunit